MFLRIRNDLAAFKFHFVKIMILTPPLIHLATSLLFSTLQVSIVPNQEAKNINKTITKAFQLFLPNKTLSFSLLNSQLIVDNIPIGNIFSDKFTVTIKCLNNFYLHIDVPESNVKRNLIVPYFCSLKDEYDLLIAPNQKENEVFIGCIRDVTFGNVILLRNWCRHKSNEYDFGEKNIHRKIRRIDSLPNYMSDEDGIKELINVSERLTVTEGETTKIQIKNIYFFSRHQHFGIQNYSTVWFEVITEPEHGRLVILQEKSRTKFINFSYDDLIKQNVEYRHDGSESVEDSFDIKLKILDFDFVPNEEIFGKLKDSSVFTIFVNVEPVNDLPQIKIGSKGPIVNLAEGARVKLSEAHLRVWDADTATQNVWLEVQRAESVRIVNQEGKRIQSFSLSQFLNGNIYLASEGENGEVEFIARDSSNSSSSSVTLRVFSVPVEINFGINTGLQLPHRSSQLITAQNLTFYSNFGAEVPLKYSIVDQPEFGLIECYRFQNSTKIEFDKFGRKITELHGEESFQLCSKFEQSDIDAFRIRYRHLSVNRPLTDSFSFQVYCADTITKIHIFHINFIPISFRIFIQESLLLNNTVELQILQQNLLATSFPQNFLSNELFYHIVEPPKFGMLSRRIDLGNGKFKFRRIGVSSNFTQQHINNGSIFYKLHFVQYSIVNDFFLFRLITPAVTSELLRYDITYVPGPNSIHLINRTLIIAEGATQQITNSTLWLETADDSNFLFTITIPPFNGRLILVNEFGANFFLDIASTFTSLDIVNKRLFYEHLGDETLFDRVYLLAKSVYRKKTEIPLWLTISIVSQNDNSPYLQVPSTADVDSADPNQNIIYLVEDSERVLYPSLMPWVDSDDIQFGATSIFSTATVDANYNTGSQSWTNTVLSKIPKFFGVNKFNSPTSVTSSSLSYHFKELFRDFIICTREYPELSVRNFTQNQLNGSLIIRHLNLKKNFNKLRYMISDGKHSVSSTLTFIALKPFIQLVFNYTCIPFTVSSLAVNVQTSSTKYFLAITVEDLSAITNIDVDMNNIVYEKLHSTSLFSLFRILRNESFWAVDSFTQLDIIENRLFLTLTELVLSNVNDGGIQTLTIPMRIIAKRTRPLPLASSHEDGVSLEKVLADVAFTIEKLSPAEWKSLTKPRKMPTIFYLNMNGIHSTFGSSVVIQSTNSFGIVPVESLFDFLSSSDIKFWLADAPRFGSLILQSSKLNANDSPQSTVTADNFVIGFRQRDLDNSRLYYLNFPLNSEKSLVNGQKFYGGRLDEDSFSVNISIPFGSHNKMAIIGPIRFFIKLSDSNQLTLIPASNLSVKVGSKLVLNSQSMRIFFPSDLFVDLNSLEYRIIEMPSNGLSKFGRLFNRYLNNQPILNSFSHIDLVNSNIIYEFDGNMSFDSKDISLHNDFGIEWILSACISSTKQSKCSTPAKLRIEIDFDNKFEPELVRNEILSVSTTATRVPLTNKYLKAIDSDTSAVNLKYLIWQTIGGIVQMQNSVDSTFSSVPIYSFSQADLDSGLIAFMFQKNISNLFNDKNSKIGFSFLVSDGLHQTRPDWFSFRRVSPDLLAKRQTVIDWTHLHDTLTTSSALGFVRGAGDESAGEDIETEIILESNARLNAVPGVVTQISSDFLKARIGNLQSHNIIFDITHQPLYGRLMLEGVVQRTIEKFTQNDIDSGYLFYHSQADLGAWSQRDSFNFIIKQQNNISQNKNENSYRLKDEGFLFRILTSYANIREKDLNKFVFRKAIQVGIGGSVLLNSSHLNLTKLSNYCDDTLFATITRWPTHGTIFRVTNELNNIVKPLQTSIFAISSVINNEIFDVNENFYDENENVENFVHNNSNLQKNVLRAKMPMRAEEFQYGKSLIYRHFAQSADEKHFSANLKDNLFLHVYSLREKQKRLNRLSIKLNVVILPQNDNEKIVMFPSTLSLVSGGKLTLSPKQFQVSHTEVGPSQIVYRITQPPSNGVRIFLTENFLDSTLNLNSQNVGIFEFTQAQINKGLVGIEHFYNYEQASNHYDVFGVQIGDSQTRVLSIQIKKLVLHLVNHTNIEYMQGKTYILLNRSHLGAESNGERSNIVYNITRRPINGSLYWVTGEKRTDYFTQKNVDDGDVLYAQLNMNAFQDSFSFVVGNDELQLLEKTSRIVVQPALRPQPFITYARTIVQIGLININVTMLQKPSARFFVVRPPIYGRLFLRPNSNISTIFFTQSDIADGNLFFHAFNVQERVNDEVELELLADNIQPARVKWLLEIRPSQSVNDLTNKNSLPIQGGTAMKEGVTPKLAAPPEIDYRFPILTLLGIIGLVVGMATCHWWNLSNEKKTDEDVVKSIPNISPQRHLPDLEEILRPNKSTATISSTSPTTFSTKSFSRGISANAMLNLEKNKTFSSYGLNVQRNLGKPDLLSSTVYATIGTNSGLNGVRNNIDSNKSFHQMLTTKTDLHSVKESIHNEFKAKPTLKNDYTSNLALKRIPILDEMSAFRNFNSTSKYERQPIIKSIEPILTVNSTETPRFILPLRRPAAVSAVVPTMATFDSSDSLPVSHSISLRKSSFEALTSDMEKQNTFTILSTPLCTSSLSNGSRESARQEAELASAAAAVLSKRNTFVNTSSSASEYSGASITSPPLRLQSHIYPTKIDEDCNVDLDNYLDASTTRFNENQYWV